MAEESGVPGEDTSYLVGGAVNLERWKIKAQYGLTEAETTNEELTLLAFGLDYKLARKSKVYAYLSQVEADLADSEDSTFCVGFKHKFSM